MGLDGFKPKTACYGGFLVPPREYVSIMYWILERVCQRILFRLPTNQQSFFGMLSPTKINAAHQNEGGILINGKVIFVHFS